MTEIITDWVVRTFSADARIVTVILSLIPLVETRGAITVGLELGLTPVVAWALACASAFLVSPVLFYCLRPLLNRWKQSKSFAKLAFLLEEVFRKKAEKIEKGKNRSAWKMALGVFIFVAIPLPLTGVWTGSAVAAFVDLDAKLALPALFLGNLTSGAIILLLNLFLGSYASLLLLVLFLFILISLFSLAITFLKKNKKEG